MGRPTLYTKALGVTICERIASGESVRNIARDDGMPQKSTIIAWSLNPEHDFYGHYEKARELRVEVMADELVDIADDGGDEGVQRSRLRIDTRKWVLSKMKPKRYGDKVEHDLSDQARDFLLSIS